MNLFLLYKPRCPSQQLIYRKRSINNNTTNITYYIQSPYIIQLCVYKNKRSLNVLFFGKCKHFCPLHLTCLSSQWTRVNTRKFKYLQQTSMLGFRWYIFILQQNGKKKSYFPLKILLIIKLELHIFCMCVYVYSYIIHLKLYFEIYVT